MLRQLLFAAALLAVPACHSALTASDAASAANLSANHASSDGLAGAGSGAESIEDVVHSDRAAAGLSVAEAHCASCHAVTAGQISPNSDAPPFASIAQRPGLTYSTADRWLRHSHNFPDQMNFTLDPGQAEELAAYLLTLREANSE
jgi:mono/diheme cytochrome c family protein